MPYRSLAKRRMSGFGGSWIRCIFSTSRKEGFLFLSKRKCEVLFLWTWGTLHCRFQRNLSFTGKLGYFQNKISFVRVFSGSISLLFEEPKPVFFPSSFNMVFFPTQMVLHKPFTVTGRTVSELKAWGQKSSFCARHAALLIAIAQRNLGSGKALVCFVFACDERWITDDKDPSYQSHTVTVNWIFSLWSLKILILNFVNVLLQVNVKACLTKTKISTFSKWFQRKPIWNFYWWQLMLGELFIRPVMSLVSSEQWSWTFSILKFACAFVFTTPKLWVFWVRVLFIFGERQAESRLSRDDGWRLLALGEAERKERKKKDPVQIEKSDPPNTFWTRGSKWKITCERMIEAPPEKNKALRPSLLKFKRKSISVHSPWFNLPHRIWSTRERLFIFLVRNLVCLQILQVQFRATQIQERRNVLFPRWSFHGCSRGLTKDARHQAVLWVT